MTVYAVYEPPSQAQDLASRADGLVLVKDGFSWGALLVPAIWLAYRRMWLELIAFIALLALLGWLFGGSDAGKTVFDWMALAIIVLFAVEANDLRGAALERRGYRIAGTATGPDRDSAELSFFQAWLPEQEKDARRPGVPKPGRASVASAPKKPGEAEEVIGFFPAP